MGKIITFKNEENDCFSQIEFENGERVLISISTEEFSVTIFKLSSDGMTPTQTLFSIDLSKAVDVFLTPKEWGKKHGIILDKIVEIVRNKQSIQDMTDQLEKLTTGEKQSNNDIMQNTFDKIKDQGKTQHSKNAIFFFFVFGIIIFILNGTPILSLGALTFFFIGMFLASVLSIPSYLIKKQISKRLGLNQVNILKKFYWIFEMAYDFVITYFLFYFYTLVF